jgi:hypothetical protein
MVEHSNPLKGLTDEQLEALIEYIETSLAAQAGAPAKMIEGTVEPISVEVQRGPLLDSPKPKNRVMLEADTAVGPSECIPRNQRASDLYGMAPSSSNGRIFRAARWILPRHRQSLQKSLNRSGAISVYLTVCWMFLCPR